MSINLIKDQKDSSKAGVQSAGKTDQKQLNTWVDNIEGVNKKVPKHIMDELSKQSKKVYTYSEVSRLLSTKDKEGNYVVKSYDDAMEKFVSDSKLGTKQFVKERWEIVKLIFRTFHSYNAGMPKSLIEQYQPIETGKDIVAAIQKKYPKLIVE